MQSLFKNEGSLQKLSECKGAKEVMEKFQIKVTKDWNKRGMTDRELEDTTFWLMKALGLQKALDSEEKV